MRRNKKGFTLLEVVFTITLIVFLISSVLFVYIVAFRNSYYMGNRTDIHEKLHFALERMIRDIRAANSVSVTSNAITFALHEGNSDVSYYYYLYNALGSWVPPAAQTFNSQLTYDLRRAAVSNFHYGDGDIIATALDSPATSNTTIAISGNVAQLQLSATLGNGQFGSDRLAVSGYVRPRNV